MDVVISVLVSVAESREAPTHTVVTISDQQLVLKVLSLLLESTA